MDKINGLNQIVEILQSRLSKSHKKDKSKTADTSRSKSESRPTSRQTVEDLEIQIVSKFKTLDRKSQNYKETAVNLFIDEVLAWEFGNQITADPEFVKLKEKIYASFRENRALDENFEKILSSF